MQGGMAGQGEVAPTPPQAALQGIFKKSNQFCPSSRWSKGGSPGNKLNMGGVIGRRGLGHTFRHVCARMAQRR